MPQQFVDMPITASSARSESTTPAGGPKGATVVFIWNLDKQTFPNAKAVREALEEIDFDVKVVKRLQCGGGFILTMEEAWHAKCLVVALNGSRHLAVQCPEKPLRVVAFGLWGQWTDAVDEDMPDWPVKLQVAYSASVRKSQLDWHEAVQKLWRGVAVLRYSAAGAKFH